MLRLREIRKSNGVTQQDLATHLKVTQATLSGWETEKFEIDNSSLIKCASYFNVSVDYLLGIDIYSAEIDCARKKIKELAQNQAIDISEFEKTFGTNYGTFRVWCNGFGDYFNSVPKILGLADFFNVSINYLLGKTDNKQQEKDTSLTPEEESVFLTAKKNSYPDFAIYRASQGLSDDDKEEILAIIELKQSRAGRSFGDFVAAESGNIHTAENEETPPKARAIIDNLDK